MKDYVKPEFFYENFQVNMSVAACTVVMNADGTVKSAPAEYQVILADGGYVSGCTFTPEDLGYYGESPVNYGST